MRCFTTGCSACLTYVKVQSLLAACFSAKAVTQQKATEVEAQCEKLVFENTVRPELRQMFFSLRLVLHLGATESRCALRLGG